MNTYNTKAIMHEANAIATAAQQTFGGKVSDYMSVALKQAWAEAKAVTVAKPVVKKVSKKVVDWGHIILVLFVMVVMLGLGTPLLLLLTNFSYILVGLMSCVIAKIIYLAIESLIEGFFVEEWMV